MRENISIKDASILHGCGEVYIRNAIRTRRIPGSYSCGNKGNGKRRTFKIPRKPFLAYLGITEDEAQNILEMKGNVKDEREVKRV